MTEAGKTARASPTSRAFARFANAIARAAGRPYTFVACLLLILLWAGAGPFARFSDTWQLIINTTTTIITFLMVFLIQNTQNRDNAAIQAKLDELIRVGDADNEFIGVEHLSDAELEAVVKKVEAYAKRLQHERRTRDGAPKRAKSTRAAKPA
jgi:low affinity Fe/Cu permease